MQIPLSRHNHPGRLYAICGIDGSGKSTSITSLVRALTASGVNESSIVRLRQPSDWWRSDERVRRTFNHDGEGVPADEVALGVYGIADRLNQQALAIIPALAAGKIVIADRYVHCLVAYYLSKREPQIDYLLSACAPLLEPDLTILLDCPPKLAIERVVRRDGVRNERHDQQLDRVTSTAETYRAIARWNGLHVIPSDQPAASVLADLQLMLQASLGHHAPADTSQ